ncbi:MAG: hypothetical protein ABW123_17970 [Cystobacter sp.]
MPPKSAPHEPARPASSPGKPGAAKSAVQRDVGDFPSKDGRRPIPGLVDRPLVKGEEHDANHRAAMRTRLLGEDTEVNTAAQAWREARLLDQMEHQGEAPARILSQLNEQLSGAQGPEFKNLLARELKPQLDRLAGQVAQASTENRRKIAAFISRAAHMAGSDNAATFEKLFTATASAEAKHLAASSGAGVVVCVSDLQSALRRGASSAYRAVLIDKSREHLERLARDSMQLPAQAFHDALVLFMGASESLGRVSCNTLAKIFLAGALGRGSPDAAGRLVKALGPALLEAPGGGNWVVRLMLNLMEGKQEAAATALAQSLQELIWKARERCGPHLGSVQTAADKGELLERSQKLDEHVTMLAGLMPMCALLLAARNVVPGGGNGALVSESLVAVACLDAVGATDNGQRMLRHTLIAEELGEPSFLGVVPVAMRPLGHPRILQQLAECGLAAAHYRNGGSLFVQRVARQVFRALGSVVLARSQKGESEEARRLLGSVLRQHAALYGMSTAGGDLAAELVERVRNHPEPDRVGRVLEELEGVGRRNPSPHRTGNVESLRALVIALAERDPLAAPKSPGHRRHVGAAPVLKASEMERTHIVQVRKLEAEREAARAEREAARAAEKPPPPARSAPARAPAGRSPSSVPAAPPAPRRTATPPPGLVAKKKPVDEDQWRESTNAMQLERTHAFQMAQRPPRHAAVEDEDGQPAPPKTPRLKG